MAAAATSTYSVEKKLSKSCARYILHRIPQRLDKVGTLNANFLTTSANKYKKLDEDDAGVVFAIW